MLTGWSAIAAILVMAIVTFALRALPFVAAGLLSRYWGRRWAAELRAGSGL